MATATINPGASAIDGAVWDSGYDQFYLQVSAAISGGTFDQDYTDQSWQVGISTIGAYTSGEYNKINRGIILFDVAGAIAAGDLPDGAIVLGATVSLYPSVTPNDNFGASLVLAAYDRTVLNSTTALTASNDFKNFRGIQTNEEPPGSGTLVAYYMHPINAEYGTARVALADIVGSTRFEFTLNDTAITEMNASITGSYPFHTSLLTDWDFDYDWADYEQPAFGADNPTWVSNVEDMVTIQSGRHVTSSYRPQLNLEYVVGTDHATLEVVGQKASSGDTLEASFLTVEVYT